MVILTDKQLKQLRSIESGAAKTLAGRKSKHKEYKIDGYERRWLEFARRRMILRSDITDGTEFITYATESGESFTYTFKHIINHGSES